MSTKPPNKLPRSPQQRKDLLDKIVNEIAILQNQNKQNADDMKLVIKNDDCIQMLQLRRRLIKKCGEYSLLRLSHLQQIFKHYCTHIFRTGRYMTFDRLEYEKVHMTMQRFFLFLKDFGLTVATIEDKVRQVIDKQNIITIFKKVSSNARETSFQEFITCIEKMAIIYWDEKMNYTKKKKEQVERMRRIKKENQKRRKKKMGIKMPESQNKKGEENEDGEEGEGEEEGKEENQQQIEDKKQEIKQVQELVPVNNQNDEFVNDLMNDVDIEDPNEQVREVAEKAKRQNAIVDDVKKMEKQEFQHLLRLTNEQKIQFYYQILQIDSIEGYKQRLTELNLANYIEHKKKKEEGQIIKALSESKLQAAMEQQEDRLQKLKAKMNEKKQKMKERPLPKPTNQKALKEEQNAKKRKEMKKEREQAVKEYKVQQTKKKDVKKQIPKVEYKEGEVTLQMLEKLTLDSLKLKNFNPSKYYTIDEDDNYFLDQYGGSRPKMSQRLQVRQRQSLSVVQSTKQRAKQLQNTERIKSSLIQHKKTTQNSSTKGRRRG